MSTLFLFFLSLNIIKNVISGNYGDTTFSFDRYAGITVPREKKDSSLTVSRSKIISGFCCSKAAKKGKTGPINTDEEVCCTERDKTSLICFWSRLPTGETKNELGVR